MNIANFLSTLWNPETRWSSLRTLLVALFVAVGSVSGTMIGTQSTVGLWQIFMERFQFPMIQSEIESLRSDVAAAPCSSNAMLISQAASFNQRIEHEHESNRHVFSDWASTDRWMKVSRIEIPSCK